MTPCPDLEITQRDDGLWSIGIGENAPGPFETREFAMSVSSYLSPATAPRLRSRDAEREVGIASTRGR